MSTKIRVIKVLARAIDHPLEEVQESSKTPEKVRKDALTALFLHLFIILLNICACISVMLNLWRHWGD